MEIAFPLRQLRFSGGGVDFANAREATSAFRLSPAIEYRPVSRVSLSHSLDQ